MSELARRHKAYKIILFDYQKGRCAYCMGQMKLTVGEVKIAATSNIATLDHILPVSKGGRSVWENVICSCASCNNKKGAKKNIPLKIRPLKKKDYYLIDNSGKVVVDLSKKQEFMAAALTKHATMV